MKKTIELVSDGFDWNRLKGTDKTGSAVYRDFICVSAMQKYFDIPSTQSGAKIWVTVSDIPLQEAYKMAKIDELGYAYEIKTDAGYEKVILYSGTHRWLVRNGYTGAFWVKVRYKYKDCMTALRRHYYERNTERMGRTVQPLAGG